MKSKAGRIFLAVICVIVLVLCIYYFVKRDDFKKEDENKPTAEITIIQ